MKIIKLNEFYRLKNMIRYNNISRIKDESVAEHSFFVSLITARLHLTYKFNLERALLMATIHDIFEIYISDIPRNVKENFNLNKIFNNIEEQIILNKYPEYYTLIKEFNTMSSIEGLIVNLADNLSVLQYVITEINLGNNIYMPDVKKEAITTIKKLKQKLIKCKR